MWTNRKRLKQDGSLFLFLIIGQCCHSDITVLGTQDPLVHLLCIR